MTAKIEMFITLWIESGILHMKEKKLENKSVLLMDNGQKAIKNGEWERERETEEGWKNNVSSGEPAI